MSPSEQYGLPEVSADAHFAGFHADALEEVLRCSVAWQDLGLDGLTGLLNSPGSDLGQHLGTHTYGLGFGMDNEFTDHAQLSGGSRAQVGKAVTDDNVIDAAHDETFVLSVYSRQVLVGGRDLVYVVVEVPTTTTFVSHDDHRLCREPCGHSDIGFVTDACRYKIGHFSPTPWLQPA